MRCAEAQELLENGHSHLLFNATNRIELSPFADEVDGHTEICPACSLALRQMLRREFWRRPGPLHFLNLRRTERSMDRMMALAARGPIAEEAPIIRVANTIIQQAIKENAEEIEVVMEPSDSPFRGPIKRAIMPREKPQPASGSLSERMGEDIRRSGYLIEPSDEPIARVRVAYRVCGDWHDVIAMPSYICPPLWARYKSMADLLLTVDDEPQSGTIRIRYENRDYTVHLSTAPDELGERLTFRIVPDNHGSL